MFFLSNQDTSNQSTRVQPSILNFNDLTHTLMQAAALTSKLNDSTFQGGKKQSPSLTLTSNCYSAFTVGADREKNTESQRLGTETIEWRWLVGWLFLAGWGGWQIVTTLSTPNSRDHDISANPTPVFGPFGVLWFDRFLSGVTPFWLGVGDTDYHCNDSLVYHCLAVASSPSSAELLVLSWATEPGLQPSAQDD